MRILIILLLVGSVAANQDLLASVCNEGSTNVPILNDVQQVRSLIAAYSSHSGRCADKFANSFEQLETVLSEENLKDVCSAKTMDQIEAYHLEFVHFYSARRSSTELKALKKRPQSELTKAIPKALYQFFILFAKHVGAKCRSEISNRLQVVYEQHLIGNSDFELLKEFFSTVKIASKRLTAMAAKFVSGHSIDSLAPPTIEAELSVAIPTGTSLPKIQQVCQAKFQPVFEEILVPVLRLNDLGYSGEYYDSHETKAFLVSPKMARWYHAYQLCEALRGISLVAIPKETCNSKRKCYGFLADEEARAMKASGAVEPHLGLVERMEIAHEAVKFHRQLVYYRDQSDADIAIKNFKSHLNRELLRSTSRMMDIETKFNQKLLKVLGIRPIPKGKERREYCLILPKLALLALIITCIVFIIMGVPG